MFNAERSKYFPSTFDTAVTSRVHAIGLPTDIPPDHLERIPGRAIPIPLEL
jgi:hypothetical protein